MINWKLLKIFGIVLGILSLVLAFVLFDQSVGYTEGSYSYGGDAYTGIQNAAEGIKRGAIPEGLVAFGGQNAIVAEQAGETYITLTAENGLLVRLAVEVKEKETEPVVTEAEPTPAATPEEEATAE